MKTKISLLMDGELDERELGEVLGALGQENEARLAWRTYHLIRDALHGEDVLAPDLAAGVAVRLAREPTVLAPQRTTQPRMRSRWMALSAAASVAAMGLVGWLAFSPRPVPEAGPVIAAQMAKAPQAAPMPVAQTKVEVPIYVPLPSAADDYLLANQAYSPRLTLQGVAPYIRTVSDETVKSDAQ